MAVHLVAWNDTTSTWNLTDAGRTLLSQLPRGFIAVCIAGSFRTGKSALMNLVAQQKAELFKVDHIAEGITKGIWAALVSEKNHPHPLLLLDTQGLLDPDSVDSDSAMFCMAALFSSLLVLNIEGLVKEDLLGCLSAMTNLIASVKTPSSTPFKDHMPSLLWLLRNARLSLPSDCPSFNDYLEQILRLKPGTTTSIKNANSCREFIKESFPSRFCIGFPSPMLGVDSKFDGKNPTNPQFIAAVDDIRARFWSAPLKRMALSSSSSSQHVPINGPEFISFVETIVSTLNSKKSLISLENAWTAISRTSCDRALKAASAQFEKLIADLPAKFPMDEAALLSRHNQAELDVLKLFRTEAMGPLVDENLGRCKQNLTSRLDELKSRNRTVSLQHCQKLVSTHWTPFATDITSNAKNESMADFQAKSKAIIDQLTKSVAGPSAAQCLLDVQKSAQTLHQIVHARVEQRRAKIRADIEATQRKLTEVDLNETSQLSAISKEMTQISTDIGALTQKLAQPKQWHGSPLSGNSCDNCRGVPEFWPFLIYECLGHPSESQCNQWKTQIQTLQQRLASAKTRSSEAQLKAKNDRTQLAQQLAQHEAENKKLAQG